MATWQPPACPSATSSKSPHLLKEFLDTFLSCPAPFPALQYSTPLILGSQSTWQALLTQVLPGTTVVTCSYVWQSHLTVFLGPLLHLTHFCIHSAQPSIWKIGPLEALPFMKMVNQVHQKANGPWKVHNLYWARGLTFHEISLKFFFNMVHFYSLLLNLLLYCSCFMFLFFGWFFFFFFFGCEACGISAHWPGTEHTNPAFEDEVPTTGLPGKSLNFFLNHSLKHALIQTYLHHCLTWSLTH